MVRPRSRLGRGGGALQGAAGPGGDAHQNLLFARTASMAQTFMRYTVGAGSASVGRWRPTTWYWWNL